MNIIPLFTTPVMKIQLDLDTDKLTEFAFQMRDNDKKGLADGINKGGWQSNNIIEENHEEFKKLKKEITHHLQVYHSTIFQGMKFKGNVTQTLATIWAIINEKHQYVDWHIHPFATLSGVFYIKHDGVENGNILFKHPEHPQMTSLNWPSEIVELYNEVTSGVVNLTPKSNMLLIFPAWLNHSTAMNLYNDPRISLSFNSILKLPETNERKVV
jgi:uncharacterized protein (TIGR02466 family)